MKIYAIDIGSNSVRLAAMADGKTLFKRIITTRLGEGLSVTGRLTEQAIERTALAVASFVRAAEEDGADKVYAFATAAVRSAENGSDFVLRVKRLCCIDVEVLSGETEALCGVSGACRGGDGGIIDVGGASTEVSVRQGGKMIYSKSVNIGTVRLFDVAGRDKKKLDEVISGKLDEYGVFDAGGYRMYAIGGTATTIASVKHSLEIYDPAVTDGTRVTREEVYQMADRLLSLTVGQVKKITGMEPRRADIVGGGCLLTAEVMRRFNVDEFTVSESDNLEGYVLMKEGRL